VCVDEVDARVDGLSLRLDHVLIYLQGTMNDIRDLLRQDRNQQARIDRLEGRVDALEKRFV
jgi:hypothetical protein